MLETKIARVSFDVGNVTKCLCPICPVQSRSRCVKKKTSSLRDALKSNPLRREEIAGLYCATGTATCEDIDVRKTCLCESCPVFRDNKLKEGKPTCYFCRDGASG